MFSKPELERTILLDMLHFLFRLNSETWIVYYSAIDYKYKEFLWYWIMPTCAVKNM